MIYKAVFLCLFIFATSISLPIFAQDTLMLRGGASVTGNVVKKTSDKLFVDLGYTIIAIPSDEIITTLKAKQKSGKTVTKGFFQTGNLKIKSVQEAVDRFASSVVVIRNSTGSMGSGFFVNTDGYIVTNFHVVQNDREFRVTRLVKKGGVVERKVYEDIKIIAVDPFHDLAVIKVENKIKAPITPVVLSAGDTRPGDLVFAIGHPHGLEQTVTEGIVSHVKRIISGVPFLQVDAPVNPGNSGGPLFNINGEVIGVINMGLLKSEGLNFAIPVREVKFLLNNLDAYAFNESNPESGIKYTEPPRKPRKTTDIREKKNDKK